MIAQTNIVSSDCRMFTLKELGLDKRHANSVIIEGAVWNRSDSIRLATLRFLDLQYYLPGGVNANDASNIWVIRVIRDEFDRLQTLDHGDNTLYGPSCVRRLALLQMSAYHSSEYVYCGVVFTDGITNYRQLYVYHPERGVSS